MREEKAFVRGSVFPTVDTDCADAEDEDKQRKQNGFESNTPGSIIEEKADERHDCDG